MKVRRPAPPAAGVDPKLVPFLDSLAVLLVAQERRLAEARRTVEQAASTSKKAGPRKQK